MNKMSLTSTKISFLNQVFGTGVLGNDSLNIAVCCPNPKCSTYGNSAKKKLVIKIDTDQYQCWSCEIKGRNLTYLLKKYFPRHLNEYQTKFLKKKIKQDERVEEEVFVSVPDNFILLAANLNSLDPDIRGTIKYLYSRGLTNRDLWYFRFGTCATGRFRRRAIMPSFNEDGELNYYVARAIDQVQKMKYLNAKVPKKNIIFNEINIDWNSELTLVEGPFDLTKCNDNATCLLGSHFTEEYSLFQKITQNKTPVLLALDPDMKLKTQEYARKLTSYGIQVRILDLGRFSDVGEMSKMDFACAQQSAKSWNSDDRLLNLFSTVKSGSIL